MNELVTIRKIEQSKLAIREVKTLDEIKQIIDQTEALKAYAKSAKLSAEIQADVSELSLRAQRQLGEISIQLEKAKSNQYKKVECPQSGHSKMEALATIGVTRQKANAAEKLAKIPEKVFEERISEAKSAAEKVTKSLFKQTEKDMLKSEKSAKKAYTTPIDLSKYCKLFEADITKQIPEIKDNSIDFIITDPPYPKEYIPLYEKLSKLASRVLKNGGSLIVMCGQSYLPEVINELCKHMTYHWCMAYITPGGQSPSLWQKNTNTFWKPVLWFTKGKYKGDYVGDVLKSPVNDNDKRFHDWGQSLAGFREIIEKFTYPEQVILDPFLGGGTTGVAAVTMGRKFIGTDIDKKNIEITESRIQEAICK